MKDYGTVQSTKQPEALLLDEKSVWVASDIKEIKMSNGLDDTAEASIGYEYNLKQYSKDEYIQTMSDNLASTQEAIDFLLMQ